VVQVLVTAKILLWVGLFSCSWVDVKCCVRDWLLLQQRFVGLRSQPWHCTDTTCWATMHRAQPSPAHWLRAHRKFSIEQLCVPMLCQTKQLACPEQFRLW
jgi:hypothetical protein